MDYQFVLDTLELILSWPVIALISLILFRKPLSSLLYAYAANPHKLDIFGIKITMNTKDISDDAEKRKPDISKNKYNEYKKIAEKSAPKAIEKAYEDSDRLVKQNLGIGEDEEGDWVTILQDKYELPKEDIKTLDKIQEVRTIVDKEPTSLVIHPSTALDYSASTLRIASTLSDPEYLSIYKR